MAARTGLSPPALASNSGALIHSATEGTGVWGMGWEWRCLRRLIRSFDGADVTCISHGMRGSGSFHGPATIRTNCD